MTEGYCAKCKAKTELIDVVEEEMRDGRRAITGKCPTCREELLRILGDEISNPPPVPVREPGAPRFELVAAAAASPP